MMGRMATLMDFLAVAPIAEAVVLMFAYAFGAGVGSFLNVVAYRLPRGESLVFGGSHCPHCGAAIRSRDNVPVVGWLVLRGRCRDCGSPISPRYPLVEAAAGLVVAVIAAIDLLGRSPGGRPGVDGLLFGESWPRVAAFVIHGWLALTWLAWGLLVWDGSRIPVAWLGATVLAAMILPTWLPDVGWLPALVTMLLPLVLVGLAGGLRRP
jgi:prepilin signal peptidase PulO-like enzyme (type II secretory pathway)